MTDREVLERYIPLAEFISKLFYDDAEVVVHDITGDLQHSVVAIFNNHVSGRQIGAPMTELGMRFIKEEQYANQNFISNYEGDRKSVV
jgi:predicted transcriptional regulator YheO